MEYGLKPLGREKFWFWVMLIPTLIGLTFGALGSILATLGLSLTNWDLLTPPTWAWISNYQALFNNPA
jgi:multiple sugar transport system permease protein